MVTAGNVVLLDFAGAMGTKRHPAVVLSTAAYYAHRPDAILGLLTTNTTKSNTPTDFILQDWAEAGLFKLTAFRAYLITSEHSTLSAIGTLCGRDWLGVQVCLQRALQLT